MSELVLLVFALSAAFVFLIGFCHRGPSWPKTIVKSIPLPVLAVIAMLGAAPISLVLALLFCGFGDFALSRHGQKWFLSGLISFALGHICFGALFWITGDFHLSSLDVVPLIVMLLFVGATVWWLDPHTAAMKMPVRFYIAIITAMVALSFLTGQAGIIILGTVLFALSDTILAFQLFRMRDDAPLQRPLSMILWSLYIAGPTLILAGFVRLPIAFH